MALTFEKTDLLITDEALTVLQVGMASTGQADPVQQVIAEQLAKVAAVAGRYSLPDGWYRAIIRAFVLFACYSLIGQKVPDNVQKSYDEAMKDWGDLKTDKYAEFLVGGTKSIHPPSTPSTGERVLTLSRDSQDGI